MCELSGDGSLLCALGALQHHHALPSFWQCERISVMSGGVNASSLFLALSQILVNNWEARLMEPLWRRKRHTSFMFVLMCGFGQEGGMLDWEMSHQFSVGNVCMCL